MPKLHTYIRELWLKKFKLPFENEGEYSVHVPSPNNDIKKNNISTSWTRGTFWLKCNDKNVRKTFEIGT